MEIPWAPGMVPTHPLHPPPTVLILALLTLWLLTGENRQKGHWVTSKTWPSKAIGLPPGSPSGPALGAQPCIVGSPEHFQGFRLAARLNHQERWRGVVSDSADHSSSHLTATAPDTKWGTVPIEPRPSCNSGAKTVSLKLLGVGRFSRSKR